MGYGDTEEEMLERFADERDRERGHSYTDVEKVIDEQIEVDALLGKMPGQSWYDAGSCKGTIAVDAKVTFRTTDNHTEIEDVDFTDVQASVYDNFHDYEPHECEIEKLKEVVIARAWKQFEDDQFGFDKKSQIKVPVNELKDSAEE